VTASRLRAVADVGATMLDAIGDDGRVLAPLVSRVASELDAVCTVWLLDPADRSLSVAYTQHEDAVRAELAAGVEAHLDGPPALAAWTGESGGEVAVWSPLVVRGRILGVLAASTAARQGLPPVADGGFGADDVAFVEAVTAAAAVALDGARLFTDSMTMLEDLRRQSELLDHISDSIVSCDGDGRILGWNAGAERLYGYAAGDAVGCDLFALLATTFFTGEGNAISHDELAAHLAQTGRWDGELRERAVDGTALTVLSSITDLAVAGGGTAGLVVVSRDVSRQRREEHLALHDALTDLPNRRMLVNRLYEALVRKGRGSGLLAILFLDLDRFKPINDAHGHAVGDVVLVETAARLTGAVRQTDLVARLGGDEFVAVLEEAGKEDNVRTVVDRVTEALAGPIGILAVPVSASIGVVLVADLPATPMNPEALLQAADTAMYEAKRTGCGSWYVTF